MPLPSNIFDWNLQPLDECYKHLAQLRSGVAEGSQTIERRESEARAPRMVRCQIAIECEAANEKVPSYCRLSIVDGKQVFSTARMDQRTQMFRNIYICSAQCYKQWSMNRYGGVVTP